MKKKNLIKLLFISVLLIFSSSAFAGPLPPHTGLDINALSTGLLETQYFPNIPRNVGPDFVYYGLNNSLGETYSTYRIYTSAHGSNNWNLLSQTGSPRLFYQDQGYNHTESVILGVLGISSSLQPLDIALCVSNANHSQNVCKILGTFPQNPTGGANEAVTTNSSTPPPTPTTPPPSTSSTTSCNYMVNQWGACQPNGTQTRTVLVSPTGCSGTPPPSQQDCVPPCNYSTGAWGDCQPNHMQIRNVTASPTGCAGTPPPSQQSCTYNPPPPTATFIPPTQQTTVPIVLPQTEFNPRGGPNKGDNNSRVRPPSTTNSDLPLQRTCHFNEEELKDLKYASYLGQTVYFIVADNNLEIGGACTYANIPLSSVNALGILANDVFIGTGSGVLKGSVSDRTTSAFRFDRHFFYNTSVHAFAAQNNYLFVATDLGLKIYLPAEPYRLYDTSITEPVYSLAIGRGNLYAGTANAVKYFSIQNLQNSIRDNAIFLNAPSLSVDTIPAGGRVNSLSISSTHAYMATSTGLHIVNLTTTPLQAGDFIPNTSQAHSVVSTESKVYVGTDSGLKVLDLNNLSSPVSTLLAGTHITGTWIDENRNVLLVGSQNPQGGSDLATYTLPAPTNSSPPPLSIQTPTALPAATAGQNYNVTLAATGGTTPYTWRVQTALPQALSFGSTTGRISGTPTSRTPASFTNISIRVTDNLGQTAERQFSMTIRPYPTQNISYHTPPQSIPVVWPNPRDGTPMPQTSSNETSIFCGSVAMGFQGQTGRYNRVNGLRLVCGNLTVNGVTNRQISTGTLGHSDSLLSPITCGTNNVPIGLGFYSDVVSPPNGSQEAPSHNIKGVSLICASFSSGAAGSPHDPVINSTRRYSGGSVGDISATVNHRTSALCPDGNVLTGLRGRYLDAGNLGIMRISSITCSSVLRNGTSVLH